MVVLLCENIQCIKPEIMVAIIAIIVSLASLYASHKSSIKTTHLSIQQELLKLVVSKTIHCNNIWNSEEEHFYFNTSGMYSRAITEIIISLELLENTFILFEKNYKGIKEKYENVLDKIFWKNLNTNLRKYIMEYKFGDTERETYKNQLRTIHNRFEFYFEIKTTSK